MLPLNLTCLRFSIRLSGDATRSLASGLGLGATCSLASAVQLGFDLDIKVVFRISLGFSIEVGLMESMLCVTSAGNHRYGFWVHHKLIGSFLILPRDY